MDPSMLNCRWNHAGINNLALKGEVSDPAFGINPKSGLLLFGLLLFIER
jgi:hypothetical protein